ncbi:MAG: hypothetical protein HY315_07820, partial [Acidobacteria bacterium]|nr:hypothetical protein [Acidobacteriota bacterium]
PAFTLAVNGSGFVSGSVVRWNGAARTTSFINANRLTASIAAADVAAAGSATVTVFNPAPGGGTSNGRSFTITAPSNPLVGDWEGTYTVTPTQFCRGTYRWTASFQVSNGVISGSWIDTFNNVQVSFRGTFDGTTARWSVQIPGDPGTIDLVTTELTSSLIEGTFTAPNCTGGSARIGGTFQGNKR